MKRFGVGRPSVRDALQALQKMGLLRVGSGERARVALVSAQERVRCLTPPGELGRLRELLVWLHRQGHPMYGHVIPNVVDVDRAEDVALAEALARADS
jgi:hypothetical protein